MTCFADDLMIFRRTCSICSRILVAALQWWWKIWVEASRWTIVDASQSNVPWRYYYEFAVSTSDAFHFVYTVSTDTYILCTRICAPS